MEWCGTCHLLSPSFLLHVFYPQMAHARQVCKLCVSNVLFPASIVGRAPSNSKASQMKLLNCGPECPLLLCTCVSKESHSLLTICRLSEELQGGLIGWNCANSLPTCIKLECRKTPQTVKHLDSAVIHGVQYLCIACSNQVMVYELPSSPEAMSCKWMDHPVIHKSSCKISHAKLRYTVFGL